SRVLTAVVMPVMGGRMLGERLVRARPTLPLVWMSGYPRDTAFAEGAVSDGGERAVLQKPISQELLVRTVAEELARVERRAGGSAPR
ncbi:MAG TPA: response regulator, partial [Gemmatimonadales bacterium]|nr:response regulator [Gemmatimonadales bacterium]